MPRITPGGAASSSLPGAASRCVPVSDGLATADFTARATSATHRAPHHIHVAATDLRFTWHNWRQNGTSASPNYADADGAAAVTIRASVEVGGVIYRLTFGGRTDVTIDAGGSAQSDPLPLDIAAGAVVWSRTFVVSGSWHYTHYSLIAGGAGGVGAASTDLTAPGSAAIADSTFGAMYAPALVTGRLLGAASSPSAMIVGDSIGAGANDHPSSTVWQHRNTVNPHLHGGGFLARALHGVAGSISGAVPGSTVQQFVTDAGHFRRMAFAQNCSTFICEYGRNDISGGRTLAQVQADLIAAWRIGSTRGLRVLQTTITPKTTSTDGWRTTASQTTASTAQETVRVALNTWIRDGAPLASAATLTAVATGTSGALRAGQSGHPLFGYWEVADACESARNSGLWKPWANTRTVNDAAITGGGNGLTSATAAFANADLGRFVFVAGAGTTGGDYYSIIQTVNSATSTNPNANAATTVSGATAVIGDGSTLDGTHPGPYLHTLMAAACDTSLLA